MQVRLDDETKEKFVPYIDDDPEGPFILGWRPYIAMATALAYFFTDEGLVVAADGLNTLRSARGREAVSRTAQKIFRAHGVDRDMACSFTGRIALYDKADANVAFNFASSFIEAADQFQAESIRNVSDFLLRVCRSVQEKLASLKRAGGFSRFPTPKNRLNPKEHTIVTVNLDGYFSGYPVRAGASFYHVDQEVYLDINAPHTLQGPRNQTNKLLGSETIGHFLFETDDARLANHRTEACKKLAASFYDSKIVITLADAIQAAQNYIEACSDRTIQYLDVENCQWIGGHIHIATITPKDGFQWVVPPKP